MKSPITISITGAAGQIGYALIFRIASGAMFGAQQPINLKLIEIEPGMKALEGVIMELEDCAFPLVREITGTTDLNEGFKGTNWALLVGSVPRKKGMERSDLLKINGKIFTSQGKAINDHADSNVRVLVIGNPCNTNALIAMHSAPDIPNKQFFAMTRLDENRAKSQLASKANTHVSNVTNLCIWGNHSATQFPDFTNAKINDQPVAACISDTNWLETEFINTVQQRGAAIIQARGLSSAASAANSIIETVISLTTPTPAEDWNSVAVYSEGQYSIESGLIASMPIYTEDCETWHVREDLLLNNFAKNKIALSIQELQEEKAAVIDLL